MLRVGEGQLPALADAHGDAAAPPLAAARAGRCRRLTSSSAPLGLPAGAQLPRACAPRSPSISCAQHRRLLCRLDHALERRRRSRRVGRADGAAWGTPVQWADRAKKAVFRGHLRTYSYCGGGRRRRRGTARTTTANWRTTGRAALWAARAGRTRPLRRQLQQPQGDGGGVGLVRRRGGGARRAQQPEHGGAGAPRRGTSSTPRARARRPTG